ncbi:f8f6db03-086c-440c-962f-f3d12ea3fa4a [Sclerotinia trifoliorum]|uniref:F8f6db03-086c-440c-962f-f3d12ea3fa4a n=1 Tax=Sclerotinia trifoliorum TaxID=28548 RepID=A0A8H2VQI3_9HELO|nr:f8f6db03-086c-440c-962f-f3d12ea3fa4a [Sclerotinia trifoliorum]
MDPAAEKAFENLIQDQESVEVILGKAKEMIWDDFAKEAGETLMFRLFDSFAGLEKLKYSIKILLEMLNEEAARLKNTGQTNTLQSLPMEIRSGIFQCLLVNIEIEEASSISQLGSYGAKIRYGLSPQILLVCRLFYHEGREILHVSNRFYVESLPLFGPASLELQPPLTLCSPLTRWINQRNEEHKYVSFHKGLLQGNSVLRQCQASFAAKSSPTFRMVSDAHWWAVLERTRNLYHSKGCGN